LREAVLTTSDLERAQEVAFFNSLRGDRSIGRRWNFEATPGG
jgi:hypothetical protein